MARTNRVKSDGDAHYHVMSRTNGKRFLFEEDGVKDVLVDALRRAAAFSGVRLKAYAAMDNHFHAVVKVEKPDAPVGEEELLRRVGILKGEREKAALAARWRRLAEAGDEAALAAAQERLRARMHDVSEFVKTFKEEFDRAFKRNREYCGSIWSGRFASTIVEDGEYLARCIRYVVHNPVRAGIVSQAADYRWSWCENESPQPGTGPAVDGQTGGDGDSTAEPETPAGGVACRNSGKWWMRRVAQIGAGKVFGSAEFVRRTAFALGSRFRARSVVARSVGAIGFATHGWRLAKKRAA